MTGTVAYRLAILTTRPHSRRPATVTSDSFRLILVSKSQASSLRFLPVFDYLPVKVKIKTIKKKTGGKMAGKTFAVIIGIINLLLVLFQVSTGKRWLKVNFIWHRRIGIVLLVTVVIHAILADLGL
jgi:hypothetical protein